MKKLCLTSVIAVFLLFLSTGIHGQTTQLDQVKLMKQTIGTWQANHGKDTVEVWECKQYGPQAFVLDMSWIIKGQKIPMNVDNIGYSQQEGKFKGFQVWTNSDYSTWIGAYTSETKFEGVLAQDLVPQPSWGKFESIMKNPKEFNWVFYNGNGVKTTDLQFVKVK
jgi:hypothetical protein